jgi:CBS domain-containing protein
MEPIPKVRHLPFLDNGIVVGIISMSDVVKLLSKFKKNYYSTFRFVYFTVVKNTYIAFVRRKLLRLIFLYHNKRFFLQNAYKRPFYR